MSGVMNNSINTILALLTVLSVTLIPEIKLAANFPTFQLIDFLLPFHLGAIYLNRNKFNYNNLYTGLLVFSLYIVFTIIINNRLNSFNDYFEVYKLIKFGIVIAFFATIKIQKFKEHVLYPVFIGLVVFNFLHYFNVFNFNVLVERFYNGGIHIKTFGLNSLGQPATKRMIGTIGNPNNNALLFGLFSVLFYPKEEKNIKQLLPFFGAILMLFLCQSRTSFVALFFMLVAAFIFNKESVKAILIVIVTVGLGYLVSFLISSNSYMGTLFDGNLTENSSLRGRFESWMYLWEMIKEKPIFGHSPFKDYFYSNNLYSENEYILMTWRYGFVGLLFYLTFLLYLFLKGINNIVFKESLHLILITLIIGVTALTNNPTSERTIWVLFAVVIGVFFNRITTNEKA